MCSVKLHTQTLDRLQWTNVNNSETQSIDLQSSSMATKAENIERDQLSGLTIPKDAVLNAWNVISATSDCLEEVAKTILIYMFLWIIISSIELCLLSMIIAVILLMKLALPAQFSKQTKVQKWYQMSVRLGATEKNTDRKTCLFLFLYPSCIRIRP